jgi:hypothetical protein
MDRLPEIAMELVHLKVDVIVTVPAFTSRPRGRRPKRYLLSWFTADPVKQVHHEPRAARGNVTGLNADASRELWSKYLTF